MYGVGFSEGSFPREYSVLLSPSALTLSTDNIHLSYWQLMTSAGMHVYIWVGTSLLYCVTLTYWGNFSLFFSLCGIWDQYLLELHHVV